MKGEEFELLIDAANELSESYVDLAHSLKDTTREAEATRRLWRNGKRSWLMKVGLALIAFPDPTVSDIVGSLMVVAGLVQEEIKHRTLHIEDLHKTFQNTFKELCFARESLSTQSFCD
jgi:hypothetical protein